MNQAIGFHQRDNQQADSCVEKLGDIGNSVLVVEHDKDIMLASDHLIDIGPKAGKHGGQVVTQGMPDEVFASGSSRPSAYFNRRKIH